MWKDFRGASRWLIEMPREVSSYSTCWNAIQLGNIDQVKTLLSHRLMSPYDVDPNGWSVLHVSSHILEMAVIKI
jgi:hypothetical protein